MSGATIRKEDRLFSLVLALSATRDGLTKGDIYRSVHGYVERFQHDSDQSLDKLFERDKKDLRDMGVVITTFELAGEQGQTHNIRYAITQEAYALPDSVDFSATEMSYLQLAAAVWRELSLGVDARHALTKLKSLGIAADSDLRYLAPRLGLEDRAFAIVTNAIDNDLILEFLYAKPGDAAPRLRRAAPLGLTRWHDHWYMLAHDIDADAQRTFLLDRVDGSVRHLPQQNFSRNSEDYSALLLHELNQLSSQNNVVLQLSPRSELIYLLTRWGATSLGDALWRVPTADVELLADEILVFSQEFTVVSGSALQEAIRRRLLDILLEAGGEHDN